MLKFLAKENLVGRDQQVRKGAWRHMGSGDRKKKLPVGIEDFREIRTEGFYYVGKTGLLQRYYGQQAVISIDEYDVPLAKASDKGYYDQLC